MFILAIVRELDEKLSLIDALPDLIMLVRRDGVILSHVGGPAVAGSPDGKYGVSIIRDLIPHELGGAVDLAFAPGGVCCKIEISLGPRATMTQ